MTFSQWVVYIIEIIGTIAFAISGAMIGIRKNMDIFGVNVLAITTALGGGLVRDLVLGIHPPNMFRDSSYALWSIATACILFIIFKWKKHLLDKHLSDAQEAFLGIMDAIGLGAFTVIGIDKAIQMGHEKVFLLIFVGVITGVGGGMIRDIMAGNTPFIFVKHIYACASIAGAIVCLLLRLVFYDFVALIIGAVVVVVIRVLAAKYRWNLPKVQ